MSTSPISRTILQNWDVLVVDDEPDNLEVAVRILKHYGATVCTAMNGQEALADEAAPALHHLRHLHAGDGWLGVHEHHKT